MNKSIKTIGVYVIGLICVVALLFGINVLKHKEFKPYTTISANNEGEVKLQILKYLDSIGNFDNEKCKDAVSFLNRSKDKISPETFNELKALVCDTIALLAESYIDDILCRDNLEYGSLSRCDENALSVLIEARWSNDTINNLHEIVKLAEKIYNLSDSDSYIVDGYEYNVKINDCSFNYCIRYGKLIIDKENTKRKIKQMITSIKADPLFEQIQQYSCVHKNFDIDFIYNNIISRIKDRL